MTRQDVEALRCKLEQGGGEDRAEAQHKLGKRTARERIALLLDTSSFLETDLFAGGRVLGRDAPGEGVVTGFGTVEGRPICVYAQDFTVLGGSVGKVHADKICRAMDTAVKTGVPLVALLDSAGARLHEGMEAVAAYARVYRKAVFCRGQVPMIGAVCGPCIGGAAWAAALMDFVFAAGAQAQMQTWGPQVMQAAGITLGSPAACGNAHFEAKTEEECLRGVRELLSLLPPNSEEDAPRADIVDDEEIRAEDLNTLVPGFYDMRLVIQTLSDGGFFATSPAYAPSLLTGFIRVSGRTVGIIANQPRSEDGIINGAACIKAAGFLQFCDAFHLPVVTLVDTCGMAMDLAEEQAGLVRRCGGLISAYAQAAVPKITVLCGRASGSAFALMGCRELGMDAVYAWPQAEISVLPADTAANILYGRQIAAAEDPNAARTAIIAQYRLDDASPAQAAQQGLIDDIILPANSRATVAAALELLLGKRSVRPFKRDPLPV